MSPITLFTLLGRYRLYRAGTRSPLHVVISVLEKKILATRWKVSVKFRAKVGV
jgi:hypothetical protein